jgi:bifunctional non-homologous end joining protein LigD
LTIVVFSLSSLGLSMCKRLAADRASFIEPCLPSPADKPPSGSNWIHEIKHDGFRLMARRDPVAIRLITRRGNDWTQRYPLVVEAVNHLKVRRPRWCAATSEGWPPFSCRRNEPQAFLYAFDLLELNGTDLRREPIEVRKATLASIRRQSRHGVRLNEHLEHDCGQTVFQPRLQDGARRHRLETAGIALSVGAVAGLAQVQESEGSRREAGG